MKYKSPLMSQASGSLAGITASHNRGGQYFRQRSTPTNPNTPYQEAIRTYVNQLSNLWSNSLTAAQRTAWNTYADNVTVVDALGDPINLTGINHYIRSNVPRLQAGLDRVDDGPTIFNLGDFTYPSIQASEATQLISLSFDNTDDWANEDDAAMILGASRPQGPAINYFQGPYRLCDTVLGNGTTPPTSPSTSTAPFPFVQGQRVHGRIRVSRADGRLSIPFRTYAVSAS